MGAKRRAGKKTEHPQADLAPFFALPAKEQLRICSEVAVDFSKNATGSIIELHTLAELGVPDAVRELHLVASFAALHLNRVAEAHPEWFWDIAASRLHWPLLYTPHRGSQAGLVQFTKSLRLGAISGISLAQEGKSFSWKTPANGIAYALYRLAQSLRRAPIAEWTKVDHFNLVRCQGNLNEGFVTEAYRQKLRALEDWGQRAAGSRLPGLSQETFKLWKSETRDFFRLVFGEPFVDHPNLQTLRRSAQGRAGRKRKKVAGPAKIERVAGPRDVENAMLRAVERSWESIATFVQDNPE